MRLSVCLRALVLALFFSVTLLPVAEARSPHTPMVTISPPYGPPGTVVNVYGSGYTKARGETLALSVAGTVVDTAVVQRDGTFTFDPVTIPSSGLQELRSTTRCDLTVTGGGYTIVAWFTVKT